MGMPTRAVAGMLRRLLQAPRMWSDGRACGAHHDCGSGCLLAAAGVSDLQRDDEFVEQEHRVATGEAALAASRWDDVIEILSECPIAPGHLPDLALRSLLAESWARMHRGELDRALELMQTAKRVAHRPGFNDVDRAEVLFRIGCVRLKRSAGSRPSTI